MQTTTIKKQYKLKMAKIYDIMNKNLNLILISHSNVFIFCTFFNNKINMKCLVIIGIFSIKLNNLFFYIFINI